MMGHSTENRRRVTRTTQIVLVSTLLAFGADAQSSQVQIAEGSGPQPLFVLDSGAAWSARWSRPRQCNKPLTSGDITSGTIFLDARMPPTADPAFPPQADLLASDVATELRKQLGGSETETPDVGDKIQWFSVPAELIIVARPDGSMTWRGLSESGDAGAVALLSTAIDSVRHRNGALMLWPDGNPTDSVVVRLSLLAHDFADDPTLPRPAVKRLRFRVFTMPYPIETPALPKGAPKVRYPMYSEQHRIEGRTITEFVVDTNGRADMSTFKDIYPKNAPTMSEEFQGYYKEFIKAVRDGVAKQIFTPARLGSCTVPQTVVMPVNFVQHRPPGSQ
jgi:hypothetical protein